MSEDAPERAAPLVTRRTLLSWLAMGSGLALSYGLLGLQGLLYLFPSRLKARTRRLFAGTFEQFPEGSVRTLTDLQGNPVLVKRTGAGFQAFSSVCPHLGCKVHWLAEEKRFLCPCHNGAFDADGRGVSGPPLGQRLAQVPLIVDEASRTVFLEVPDPGGKA